MIRKIIFYENHFIDFYSAQNEKLKTKIQYVFELIRQVEMVPEKFLKNLSGHKGLYEIRISYQSESYRIFCCFDEGKLVVLFNAFCKKSQKTPPIELEKADRLMKEYFSTKR
jgi:phage-related protein